jgi:hypothetical protein
MQVGLWLKRLFRHPRYCQQCGSTLEKAWDGFGYTSPICRNYRCTIGYSLIDEDTFQAVEQARKNGGKVYDYEHC